jgi:hypothetical protein
VTWDPPQGRPSFSTLSSQPLAGIWCPLATVCFTVASDRGLLVTTNPDAGAGAWTIAYPSSEVAALSCPTSSLCLAGTHTGDLIIGAPPPTTSEIKALLLHEIVPAGPRARIGQLLEHDGYSMSVQAQAPGRTVVSWYQFLKHRPGATLRTLVATGKATARQPGTLRIALKLTSGGRRLLTRTDRLTLTASGTFTPTTSRSLTAMRTFQIGR